MSATKPSRGVSKQFEKNAFLVAQEITFAKILSGNDPKIRERGIKRLQKWLTARSASTCQFQENDLKRIWKGLFYCMWMSDKPLIQEEVAENISNLVHCFKSTKSFLCFVKCFFLTMSVEWRGLDNWRMDKFLMFVRRFMRQVFVYCNHQCWSLKLVEELGSVFSCTILPDSRALSENPHPPLGFSIHFVDVYIDELTKVSRGHLHNDELLVGLLRPFALYVSESPEKSVANEIVSQVFDRLIEQSTEGHKFREKFEAWKQLGFPRGNIDAVERVEAEDSEAEEENEPGDEGESDVLDPRAGGVDVELPVANYNPEVVVNLLREYRHSKTSTSWSRKIIARLTARFNALIQGNYPLGFKKVDTVPKINFKKLAKKSADELLEFRDDIMNEDDEEWMESLRGNKTARRKKRKSNESDESDLEDDDDGSDLDEDEDGSDVDIDEEDDGSDVDIDEDDVDIDEDDDGSDVDHEEADGGSDVDLDEDDGSDEDLDEDDGSDVDLDEHSDGNDVDLDEGDGIDKDDGEASEDTNHDSDVAMENGDSEKVAEQKKSEESTKLKLGKKNKNKKNKIAIESVITEKQKPKNLPRVIACGNFKKQKNSKVSEVITPVKKFSKDSPLVTPEKKLGKKSQVEVTPAKTSPQGITNGISENQKKGLKKDTPKKEEGKNVIIVGRKRKLAEALSTPLIHRGKRPNNFQNSPRTPQPPGSVKKVQFILQRNTAQATSEYDRILRENPGNPYDSAKKPRFGVLKSTLLASPVNPFYKP